MSIKADTRKYILGWYKEEKNMKHIVINAKDLFNRKNNPTRRIDYEFAEKLLKKLEKENKKK